MLVGLIHYCLLQIWYSFLTMSKYGVDNKTSHQDKTSQQRIKQTNERDKGQYIVPFGLEQQRLAYISLAV